MTKLSRTYDQVRFRPELFKELIEKARSQAAAESMEYDRNNNSNYSAEAWAAEQGEHFRTVSMLRNATVSFTGDTWEYDSDEDFVSALESDYLSSSFQLPIGIWGDGALEFDGWNGGARVTVERPSREAVLEWLAIFDTYAESHPLDDTDSRTAVGDPAVFIAHGRSPIWHQINTHLTSRGYRTVFYESEPRANRTIKDILAEMGQNVDFAVIVATAEDSVVEDSGAEQLDQVSRPRQNVIHEMGYFQAMVGFDRTAVLLEDGTQTPSNYDGFQYIGFRPGHVGDVFASLVETIERERRGA